MSELPPIVLLLDLSALLAGQSREWQDFSRLGKCFVPQVVYQELQSLSQGAIEKSHELTARELIRFLPDSGWELTGAGAMHPALLPTPGHRESKRSRLALMVAECAYGVARQSPGRLVVLVSNDQTLVQQLHLVQAANLCGLPLSALLTWSRSARRPPVVTHQMQAMRSAVRPQQIASKTMMATVASPPPTRPAPSRPVTRPGTRGARPLRPLASAHPNGLSQVMSALRAVVALTIAVGIVWYVAQPQSLNRWLRHFKLPTLPQISLVPPRSLNS